VELDALDVLLSDLHCALGDLQSVSRSLRLGGITDQAENVIEACQLVEEIKINLTYLFDSNVERER
jgi:hypothetical protein